MIKFRYITNLVFILSYLIGSRWSYPQSRGESSLEEQIGQMIMVGFRGLAIDSTHSIVKDIRKHHIGGVILFDYDVPRKSPVRNIQSPEQLKKLTKQLQQFAETPLLIAVDQEGGRIQRLKPKFGFPGTCSAQQIGARNDTSVTRKNASLIAETLQETGINFNFAPVVDLNCNPVNPIIGQLERSFSEDPEIVTEHASVFIRTHKEKGILCAIKHFPGHGSSAQDSHLGTADITKTWSKVEQVPFKDLIRKDLVDAVLTAHVYHSRLDSLYPASLSHNLLTKTLREELGFNGVIISDDLQMKAITDIYGFEKTIELAVNAGVDILLFANNTEFGENVAEKAVWTVKKLIKEGRISQKRIQGSYQRIQKLKLEIIKPHKVY